MTMLLLAIAIQSCGGGGGGQSSGQASTSPTPSPTPPPSNSNSDIVSLKVTESSGVVQPSAKVRSGVPFPKGTLLPTDNVKLFDGNTELATQSKILSKWGDGSIRWLLLDGVVSLLANEIKTLTLKKVISTTTPTGISITESANLVTVDTGTLKVEIPKTYGGIIHQAWINNQLVISPPSSNATDRGAFISVYDSASNTSDDFYSSQLRNNSVPLNSDPIKTYKDRVLSSGNSAFNLYDPWNLEVVVEESAALHSVIRISGSPLNSTGLGFSSFIVRLHFYKNDSTIKVSHSMVYTGDETKQIKKYGLKLPMLGASTLIEGVAANTGEVRHLNYSSYDLNGANTSGQALGYIGRSNGNASMSIILRNMAEHFPKSLVATTNGLEVQLYPESTSPWNLTKYVPAPADSNSSTFPGVEIASRIGGETTRFTNHFFLRGAQGLSTSNDYAIIFGAGGLNNTLLQQQAKSIDQGPLMLVAPATWYSNAKVMGIGSFAFAHDVNASQGHYRIDRVLQIARDFMRVAQRKQFNWFGIENYGDIRGRFFGSKGGTHTFYEKGRYGWSGNSGEPSNQLWVQYLRKPTQQTFLDAEALARHTLDQQTVHFATSSAEAGTELDGRNMFGSVGSLHRHGVQAWSGYAGSPDYSHVAGIETYYYLTGDQRAKDVLYEQAQFIVRQSDAKVSIKNGLDVVDRAAAVFYDEPASKLEFDNKIAVFMNYLKSDPSGTGYNAVQERLIDRANSNGIHDRTDGSRTNRALYQAGFEYFIRGAPGLLYRHERTGDADAAQLIFDAANVLTKGDPKTPTSNGDDWQLGLDGHAGSLFYHINSLTYAAEIASTYNIDATDYYNLAKRCVENNTHGGADFNDTSPISLQILTNMPSDWKQWQWTWQEGASFDASNPGILWLDRVIMYQNNYVQDYHSYRSFIHLSTGAALVSQGEMQLR